MSFVPPRVDLRRPPPGIPSSGPSRQIARPTTKRTLPPAPDAGPSKQARTVPEPTSQPSWLSSDRKPPAPKPAVQAETYIVSTSDGEASEAALQTLVGEYIEKGANHGRQVFQKVQPQGTSTNVLLYYWDGRDGESFQGWWFGNKLGGSEVWSHNVDQGKSPPGSGWKIPWDGEIRPNLLVESQTAQQTRAAMDAHQDLSDEVSVLEVESKVVLEEVTSAMEKNEMGVLAELEKTMPNQVIKLSDIARKVAERQKSFQGEALKSFKKLGTQIRQIQDSLNQEYARIRSATKKAAEEEQMRELELNDTQILEVLLPETVLRVNEVEDEVDKAIITKEMLAAYDEEEDVQMAKQAIAETEKAARAATSVMIKAKQFFHEKMAEAKRLSTTSVRNRALEELGKLQKQLQDAHEKLKPLKTLRQDWEQAKRTQKLLLEVEEKFMTTEADLDRAEEALKTLEDTLTKEDLLASKPLVQAAEDRVTQVSKVLESKREQLAAGNNEANLATLDAKVTQAKERAAALKAGFKDTQDRLISNGYLEEAASKMKNLTEAIIRLEACEAEAEATVEDLSMEETLATAKTSEVTAATAQQAFSASKVYIQMKSLEVKRLSPNTATSVTAKFKELEKQLEAANYQLNELRSGINRRKSKALVKEALEKVDHAEELVVRMKEASSVWSDDDKIAALSTAELREASEQSALREKESNAAISEARKFVSSRQIEAKGKDGFNEVGNELTKLQARLAEAQSEIGKQRKIYATLEQRFAIRRVVEEVDKKLKAAEEKVSVLQGKCAAIAELVPKPGASSSAAVDQEPAQKSVKEAENLAQETLIDVRSLSRTMETNSRSKLMSADSKASIESRLQLAQERLQSASSELKERSEQLFVGSILRESERKRSECEEVFNKAAREVAEVVDLQREGATADAAEVGNLLTKLDKSIQAAIVAMSSAKTDVSMKRLSIKRISSKAGEAANEGLTKMITSLEGLSLEMSKLRGQAAEERRKLFQKSRVKA
eukprot:TRINITY_DN50127_c0_g1_i1.p1 TRINITY_DN50127_c0_g1~~TRINITY_DN50127_c0_g1_i1.p1  ORF type:complete len:1005 (+),score=281.52 TRINITY_DN50127_c0_g1_i1:49-3063(+)